LELAYGKALKATDRIDGAIPVYGSGGVTGCHNESLIDGPAIIVGRKGTVGSLYWEDRSLYPIDTVFYVKPKVQLTYCFYLLQTLALETMNTDAAVPGLNRNNVYRLLTSMPDEKIRAGFERSAKSLRSQIFANTEQVKSLSELRETLLPQLLSGELTLQGVDAK
jgi:type I restriction enzyme S subunit